MVRRLLRHRLLHFAVIGAAIFALAPKNEDGREVSLSRASLDALRAAEADHLQIPELSEEKAAEVDARAIEDEILYREALRLGLDRDDPILRQRLVHKLLLLVEDLGGASRAPTEEDLRAYFEETRESRRKAPAYRIAHVFAAERDRLPDEVSLAKGEPFPYPRALVATKGELASTYGDAFADAIAGATGASVVAPSRFGWHRVRIDERIPGAPQTFEEARADLVLEYVLARRERVVGAYLKKTVAEYRVVIDGKPLEGFTPTRRVAIRMAASAED